MEFFIASFIVIVVACIYFNYDPKIDIVLSNNKRRVLLWYNKYDSGYVSRVYKQLFEL